MSSPELSTAPLPRRSVCPRCARPGVACLCDLVTPVDNSIEVLLLQHPLEAREAKNSARLLVLGLSRVRLEVGEQFDPVTLARWIGPGGHLLYPQIEVSPDDRLQMQEAVDNSGFASRGEVDRLVVLDATWRKSLRMLHRNPLLWALPRVALRDRPPARYGAMRRARSEGQLSTLEAVCAALGQLEQAPDRYVPMLAGFDRFIARWQAQVRPATSPAAPG